MAKLDQEYAENPRGDYRFWTLDYAEYPDNSGNPASAEFKAPLLDYGSARDEEKRRYYDPTVLDREIDRLWRKAWVIVGHVNDIPRPNNFLKAEIGRDSILLIRQADGAIRAMHNVCQHRGTILVTQDYGSTKILACPFHGWQWNNDGSLRKIMKPETYRKSALCYDLDLPEVKVAVWKGWLFVNMDPACASLEEFIPQEFRDVHEAYEFDRMVRVVDVQQDWHVNWKTAMEAFLEAYHLEALHPQMNPFFDAYENQIDLYENGFARTIHANLRPNPTSADFRPEGLPEECKVFLREAGVTDDEMPADIDGVRPAILKAKRNNQDSLGIDYSRFSDGQVIDNWNDSIFPSCTFSFVPEGVLVQRWMPHATNPRITHYHYQVYILPGIKEVPSYMGVPPEADRTGTKILQRTYADTGDLDILGPVLAQDAMFIPRVQRGIETIGFRGAILSDLEIRIRQFYDVYDRMMA